MVESIVLVCSISLFASFLTFFSGFGLGTLLTPFFYFVFNDIAIAIAATAIVHLANNLFKFFLLKNNVHLKIALKFGIPAIFGALIGAYLLRNLSDIVLFEYSINNQFYKVSAIKMTLSISLLFFSIIELLPNTKLEFKNSWLAIGGFISGFFGGISGHQGALRTAFLIKYKLDKEVFIATGVVIATLIDVPRIFIYFDEILLFDIQSNGLIILSSILTAFLGAVIGKLLLKKITIERVHTIVGFAMIAFSIVLAMGVI